MGAWAFLVGVVLAVIFGIATKGILGTTVASLLVIMGIVVGLLNVTAKESQPFMMAGIVLVLVSSFGGDVISKINTVGPYVGGILTAILVLFVPATIIVALKSVFELAKD